MRAFASALTIAIAMMTATAALAQDAAPVIKSGTMIRDAGGKTIGRVVRVIDQDGRATGVRVIIDEKMVIIPVSTLSTADGLTRTSLTIAEARKL
jgi:hypothetical protein